MTVHATEIRRRVSEPTTPSRAAGPDPAGPEPLAPLDEARLHSLQRTAGNAAAVALIQRRSTSLAAQRARSKPGAFGEVTPANPAGGWKGADVRGPGWNVGEKEIGNMRRIPVDDLPVGKQTEGRAANDQLTDEKAGKRAILIAPKDLVPTDTVDAIVHLHGYTEEDAGRPFAGLRQHKTSGDVRDVALDQVETQMEAANQPQLVAILAQGGVRSEFGEGDKTYGLDPSTYAKKVLEAAQQQGAWKVVPSLGRTVLSAHSGGAHTVKTALEAELDDTNKVKGLRQVKGVSGFAQVVLFDAITGPKELALFKEWTQARLNADLAALKAKKTDAEKAAYLKTSIRFRGYYATYQYSYGQLATTICDWFKEHYAELGTFANELWTHYQVIDTGLGAKGHEFVMRGSNPNDTKTPTGKGNILDAIESLANPTAAKTVEESCGIVPAQPTATPTSRASN